MMSAFGVGLGPAVSEWAEKSPALFECVGLSEKKQTGLGGLSLSNRRS